MSLSDLTTYALLKHQLSYLPDPNANLPGRPRKPTESPVLFRPAQQNTTKHTPRQARTPKQHLINGAALWNGPGERANRTPTRREKSTRKSEKGKFTFRKLDYNINIKV